MNKAFDHIKMDNSYFYGKLFISAEHFFFLNMAPQD